MSGRLVPWSAVFLSLVIAWPAAGQYTNRSYNNPGLHTPSARVGRVGGVATRSSVSGLPRSSRVATNARTRGFAGFGGGRVAAAQALTPSYVGLIGGGAPGTGSNPYAARQVSGLGSLLSLTAPWNGGRIRMMRMSDEPYFVPEQARSSFEDYFELTPPPSARPELAPGQQFAPPAEVMQNDRARELEERRQVVIKAFRETMVRRPDGATTEVLALAESLDIQLALIPDWSLGTLLRLHVALELDQQIVATHCLKSAVSHDGSVFAKIPSVDQYFGDRTVMQDQLRRNLRVGEDAGVSAEAYALQAYCAWQLGELGRARAALQKFRSLASDAEVDPRVREIATALSGAIQ